MARMIPSGWDDTTPPGEREVFAKLAAGPDDWLAIHSLDISPWNGERRTEIDFVVVIPDVGAICLEIKSHEHISFDGNSWFPPTIKRSPWKQAADAKFAFVRGISRVDKALARLPVVHCCIFTESSFEIPENLAVQPWEIMDAREFAGLADGIPFCRNLRERALRGIEADRQIVPLREPLSRSEVERFSAECLPIRKRRPDLREDLVSREQALQRILSVQQNPIVRLTECNPRVLVSGAAGTGKSIIALGVARKMAHSGARVGLLCFNRLMGKWLHDQAGATPTLPNLIAGSAHQIITEVLGIQVPDEVPPAYWDEELPAAVEDRLTDPALSESAPFDYLVLDEAQDVLARPNLWKMVASFVQDGHMDGRFLLLGDFEHQVLSGRDHVQHALSELRETVRPAEWALRENCRNFQIVGRTAARLGGFAHTMYSAYLRTGGSTDDLDIEFYSTVDEQLEIVAKFLKHFTDKGYRPSEIVILSAKSDEDSAASLLGRRGWQVRPLRHGNRPSSYSYSSIQAFKGLENKIVVLTDIRLNTAVEARDLLYTGMTRATESVRICCDTGSKPALNSWLTEDVN